VRLVLGRRRGDGPDRRGPGRLCRGGRAAPGSGASDRQDAHRADRAGRLRRGLGPGGRLRDRRRRLVAQAMSSNASAPPRRPMSRPVRIALVALFAAGLPFGLAVVYLTWWSPWSWLGVALMSFSPM